LVAVLPSAGAEAPFLKPPDQQSVHVAMIDQPDRNDCPFSLSISNPFKITKETTGNHGGGESQITQIKFRGFDAAAFCWVEGFEDPVPKRKSSLDPCNLWFSSSVVPGGLRGESLGTSQRGTFCAVLNPRARSSYLLN
jgi:hypothetical protein